MQAGLTAYDLLLSYPSDMSFCTPLVKDALSEFNNHFGREHELVVRPIHWKDDAYPTIGDTPQTILNKQIVDAADLVFSCFWTRFGTPTEGYGSGTEEEIDRAVKSGKQVFLYFLDKPVNPSVVDLTQFAAVQSFRKAHEASGLYLVAEDERSLATDFRQKMELYFTAEVNKKRLAGSSRSKRILWVDDRPENNVYERRLFESFGIRFSLALSTDDALGILKHETFALIISDMGRKEGPREGYVLLDALRAAGNDTPLVFYAAVSEPKHEIETRQHGGQGCTSQPSVLADLVIKLLLSAAPA